MAAVLAFGGTFTVVSAQAQAAPANVVHGTVDGHVYQTGGTAKAPLTDTDGGPLPYDLQLNLSEGRQHADASGAKVTITGAAGQKVFSLDDAGALTDVDLPAGHYHVIADFGRIKRMGSVDVEKGELATVYLHGSNEPS